jgi:hypothetical protein
LVAARAHPGGTHLALGVAETVSEQVVMVRPFMCLDVAPVLIPPVRRSVPISGSYTIPEVHSSTRASSDEWETESEDLTRRTSGGRVGDVRCLKELNRPMDFYIL